MLVAAEHGGYCVYIHNDGIIDGDPTGLAAYLAGVALLNPWWVNLPPALLIAAAAQQERVKELEGRVAKLEAHWAEAAPCP